MDLTRVVVADDEPAVRQSVTTILSSEPSLSVVAEVDSGPAAVDATTSLDPDVVLMDIRMPGGDGLSATEAIRRRRPGQAVVILTTFGEDAYVDRALRLGVNGFLLKTAGPFELTHGVMAAAAGGACLSPRVAARLIRHVPYGVGVGSEPPARHEVLDGLTPRERQVLLSLARGLSNAEIASEHHLTEGTVKGYVSALFLRLGVRNRVEAAILAHEARLPERHAGRPAVHAQGAATRSSAPFRRR